MAYIEHVRDSLTGPITDDYLQQRIREGWKPVLIEWEREVTSEQWSADRLRKEKPDQFEKPIEPPPDGDSWFHAKVVVEKRQVKVFVNGAAEPSLVVNELSDRSGGSVGLWCVATASSPT